MNKTLTGSVASEEGMVVNGAAADETSTAPSVTESGTDTGSHGQDDNTKRTTTSTWSSRRRILITFLLVAIVASIITAVVLVASNHDASNSSTTSTSSNPQDDDSHSNSNEDFVYVKPFEEFALPPLNQDALQSYRTREELEEDLTKCAQAMVNRIIEENLHSSMFSQGTVAAKTAKAATPTNNYNKVKQSSFLTNNQEKNADEADVIKADDLYVYAAYGSFLVVWEKNQGRLVAQAKMPKDIHDNYVSNYTSVKAIQLTSNHVVVIAGELGEYYTDNTPVIQRNNYQVRVYTKPTPALGQLANTTYTLPLVATRFLHGYYIASHYLQASDSVHIVTGNEIDSLFPYHQLMPTPMEQAGSKDQYVQAAVKRAKETFIPYFVNGIADDFWSSSGSFMRINSFLPWEDDASRIGGYVQVTSFRASDLGMEEGTLKASTTTLLTPYANPYAYAVNDSIVVAVNHWNYNRNTTEEMDKLALIHLKVDNTTSEAHFFSFAHLEGQYDYKTRAMDLVGHDLRVAVNRYQWNPYKVGHGVCGAKNVAIRNEDPCMNRTNWQQCHDLATRDYCKTILKTGCPYSFSCGDDETKSTTDLQVIVLDTAEPGEMAELGRVRIGEPHQLITAAQFGETSAHIMTRIINSESPTHSTFYALKLQAGRAPELEGSLTELDGISFYLQPVSEKASHLFGIGRNVLGSGQRENWIDLVVTVFDVSNRSDPLLVSSKVLKGVRSQISRYDVKGVQYREGVLVIPVYQSNTRNGSVVVLDVQGDGATELYRHDLDEGGDTDGCSSCWNFLHVRALFFDDNTIMGTSKNTVVSMDASSGEELWSVDVTVEGTGNCC